jgi:hypothetical protein
VDPHAWSACHLDPLWLCWRGLARACSLPALRAAAVAQRQQDSGKRGVIVWWLLTDIVIGAAAVLTILFFVGRHTSTGGFIAASGPAKGPAAAADLAAESKVGWA